MVWTESSEIHLVKSLILNCKFLVNLWSSLNPVVTILKLPVCISFGWLGQFKYQQSNCYHSDHGASKKLINQLALRYHDLTDLGTLILIKIIPKEDTLNWALRDSKQSSVNADLWPKACSRQQQQQQQQNNTKQKLLLLGFWCWRSPDKQHI